MPTFMSYEQRVYIKKAIENDIRREHPGLKPEAVEALVDTSMVAVEMAVTLPNNPILIYALNAIDIAAHDEGKLLKGE